MWPQVTSLDFFEFRILDLGHSAHYEHDPLETKLIGYVHGDASEPGTVSPQPPTNKYAAMLEVRLARQPHNTEKVMSIPLAVGETYQSTEAMTNDDMVIMITGLLESLEMLAISADAEILEALGKMAFAGTKVICFDAHVASKVRETDLGSAHVIVPGVDCGTQKIAVLMAPAIDVDVL